uniref:Zinc carboxypeptidase A 1 n=1 Tax=Steinernema glaseri TaxID=37863 RepID=A0A1I7YUN2_9BILA
MRWLLPLSWLLLCVCSEARLDSATQEVGKYRVVRIVPRDEAEIGMLKKIYKTAHDFDLDFWKAPTGVGQFVDIMVAPTFSDSFDRFLGSKNFSYTVTIDDVQKMILLKEKPRAAVDFSLNPLLRDFFRKRLSDDFSSRNTAKYTFGDYHSYDTMVNWMNEIERNYPSMAKVFSLGTTFEGRAIKGIKIGNNIEDTSKRIVWIDGGMHAREWAAIHTALWFIDQLIGNYGVDPQITAYVDTLNFYITPVVNPDGFEYSRSEANPQTRFWRKNRGQQVCKKDRWRRERCCGGVDLNRNFDFHFGETGSSEDLCSEIYQGKYAFSEPESRAVRDKMFSSELYGKVDAFITLHTYSQMWIHPFNHERRSFPNDIFDLQTVGRKGVKAIESMYGTKFKFGTGADILYPSAGGSDDWAKAKAHVKYVYLLELRPGEEEWDGFLLDRRQLIPTARETWEGVKVVIDAVMAMAKRSGFSHQRTSLFPTTTPSTTTFSTTPSTTTATTTTPTTTVFFTTTNPPPALPPSPPPTFAPNPAPVFQPSQSTFRQNPQPVNPQPSQPAPAFNQNRPNPNFPAPQARQPDQGVRVQLQKKLEQARNRQVQARREYERRLRLFEAQREAANRLREQQARAQWQLQQVCVDRSPWCSSWIQQSANICRTSSIYMRQDCARSCGYCRSF